MKMKDTEEMWSGKFGDDYTDRNAEPADDVFKKRFGISRTELNAVFLDGISRNSSILEIGCNRGNQLQVLKRMGFTRLAGIELNKKAVEIASLDKDLRIMNGSGFAVPSLDNSFDLVFTSGVLIHISPVDLHKIVDEMYRLSKRYIWCYEYYSKDIVPVEYAGRKDRLWKRDFMKVFLLRHPDLRVVKEVKMKQKYKGQFLEDIARFLLHKENVDAMFLLEKCAARKCRYTQMEFGVGRCQRGMAMLKCDGYVKDCPIAVNEKIK
jgi:pseudaminic acid biosynthesis-associated methylase